MSPLCVAVRRKSVNMVTLLLDNGAKIDVMDGWNSTPLEIASRNGDADMMKLLLARHAMVNDQDDGGSWALYGAAVENKPAAVSLLLAHGANPNTKENTTESGDTVLSAAKLFHYSDVADMLKKAGAK